MGPVGRVLVEHIHHFPPVQGLSTRAGIRNSHFDVWLIICLFRTPNRRFRGLIPR